VNAPTFASGLIRETYAIRTAAGHGRLANRIPWHGMKSTSSRGASAVETEDNARVSARRDVVFWYSAINPYMAERFSSLNERGRLAFECWFNRHTNPGRDWLIPPALLNFPYRYLPKIASPLGTIGLPFSAYVRAQPRILISFHGDVSVAPSVLHRLRPRGKLVYYVERTFSTWLKRDRAKESMKRFLLGGAAGCLTPGRDADEYAASYGVPRRRILRLEHVVDVPRFGRAHAMRRLPLTYARRADYGLGGYVFLYVGRLWWQKGIDSLIDAFARIRQRGIDASLLLVGEGPDRTRYEDLVKTMGLRDVRFTGFVQQLDLPGMYALADAFVFPTRGDPYGLVVDEAMASGLPIISSTSAGEIASRVVDRQNGFLVPLDDPESLAKAMAQLAENTANSARMGEASLKLVERRTPDAWAAQLETAVEQILHW
jgi:glycosyltransferase involved in cell wall biosynthesis